MGDGPIVEVSGLQLSNNTFSASPPGALYRADNAVMPQKGVIQPRNGQDRAYVPPTAQEIPLGQTEFKGSLIINSGTDKFDDYTLGIAANPTVDFTGGPWNPVDSTPDSAAYGCMKFAPAGGYLAFCTTTGPKTLETLDDDPRSAGLLRMLDPLVFMASANLLEDGTGLEYGKSRAYRTLVRLPTADGVSLLSPPSGRVVITNRLLAPIGAMTRTGGTTVTVTFPGNTATQLGVDMGDSFDLTPGEANFAAGTYTVASVTGNVITYADAGANVSNTVAQDFDTGPRPVAVEPFFTSDVTTETPVRIYRSRDTANATIEPSDEMFLVAEHLPDSSEITAGFFLYVDTVPQSVTSDPLYTNPQTGEGPLQANYAPPLYRDVTAWGDRVWYAQTTGLQTLNIQMLGVGTPDGVQDGDTITIDIPGATNTPFELTFKTTASADDEVQIVSDSTQSINIQGTARNLIEAIYLTIGQGGDAEPFAAYYASAQNEAPGKILLQRTNYVQDNILDDGIFSVIASRPASWTPALSSTDPVWSNDEYRPNGLAYSKLGQPESVPVLNYTAIGSKNYPIARILGLQNALLVFKQGDGIYAVSGNAPFQVLQIATANIIAPDAACVLADGAWVYTDQGVLRVSDSGGSTCVSRPIEVQLNTLRAEMPDETANWSFMVPYETERRLLLFVPFSGSESVAPPILKAWVYNNATQAWTGPLDYGQPYSGCVGLIANRLSLGVYDSEWATGRVTLERKGDGYADFADADFSNSITAVDVGSNPLVVTLSSMSDVEAGDGIVQGQWHTKIAALRPDLGTRCVEVYEDVPFTVAACTIYKHYDVTVQFQPTTPTSRRVLTRLQWLFLPEWFACLDGQTLVRTDQVQADNEVETPFAGFGSKPFGVTPFGDSSPLMVDVNPLEAKWTTAAQFFPGFALSEAWPKFKLQGVGLTLDSASGPAGRGK